MTTRRRVLAALVLGLGLTSGALADQRFEVVDMAHFKAKPSLAKIVRAIAFLSQGRAQGTGIFVSPYHVLSAAHVTENMKCEGLKVRTLIQAANKPRLLGRSVSCTEMIFEDRDMDVALFATDRAVRDFVRLPKVSPLEAKRPLMAIGYTTLGFMGFATNCGITAVQGPAREIQASNGGTARLDNFFLSDCMLTPGMSGGPVFLADQPEDRPLVVGLNAMILGSSQGNAYEVSSALADLSRVIEKHQDKFEEVFQMAGFKD